MGNTLLTNVFFGLIIVCQDFECKQDPAAWSCCSNSDFAELYNRYGDKFCLPEVEKCKNKFKSNPEKMKAIEDLKENICASSKRMSNFDQIFCKG